MLNTVKHLKKSYQWNFKSTALIQKYLHVENFYFYVVTFTVILWDLKIKCDRIEDNYLHIYLSMLDFLRKAQENFYL